MKLLVRGGALLVGALFASFLIFYAQPLSAITNPSPQPAQQEQQEKKEHAVTEPKKEASKDTTAVVELSSTGVSPANDSTVKVDPTATTTLAPLTAPQTYVATSYSRRGRGASGMGVRFGTIAADSRVLPFGTRVRIDAGQYSGEYIVTDAGTAIKGNKIDLWLPTYREACRFGRRNVKLTVLSYGPKRGAKKR
ncbi:MAG TPA: 3D domain-containing protein [Pyrinomonadaceae bacterium]